MLFFHFAPHIYFRERMAFYYDWLELDKSSPSVIKTDSSGSRKKYIHGGASDDKNTTDLPLRLKQSLAQLEYPPPENPKEFLKYNQYILREYVKKYPEQRGMLVYVKMGYGKSIIAASIAHYYHTIDPHRNIICLLASGLIENFKENTRKYLRAIGAPLDSIKDYKFISIGASNMFEQLASSPEQRALDKKLGIMIDDIKRQLLQNTLQPGIIGTTHNLFNHSLVAQNGLPPNPGHCNECEKYQIIISNRDSNY